MRNKKKIFLLTVPVFIILFFSLFFQSNNKNENMHEGLSKDLFLLSSQNIYFGHRSVGENIISGMKKIISEDTSSGLRITKLENLKYNGSRYFADSNIGKNGDPESKIKEFARTVDSLSTLGLNLAMMKFCYVDITSSTDVNSVFNYYAGAIASLKRKHPGLTIINFTVPLTAQRSLYRKLVDLVKGNDSNNQADNAARNKFNELLKSQFPHDEIFDLAGIESTYPDGKRNTEITDGKIVLLPS